MSWRGLSALVAVLWCAAVPAAGQAPAESPTPTQAPAETVEAVSEEERARGWFQLTLGPDSAQADRELRLDVRLDDGGLSQQLGATWRLADPLALEIEWGSALVSGAGGEAAVLGNPFVGLTTPLGTVGVAAPTVGGDGEANAPGSARRDALLHRGGADPWTWLAHHGAAVARTRLAAEVGHSLYGRVGVAIRPTIALLRDAGSDGAALTYIGLALEAYAQLHFLRLGLEQRFHWLDGERFSETEAYLGFGIGDLFFRLGVVVASERPDEAEGDVAGTLTVGARFE